MAPAIMWRGIFDRRGTGVEFPLGLAENDEPRRPQLPIHLRHDLGKRAALREARIDDLNPTLDQRHLDADALARMLRDAREASECFAQEGNVTVAWERLWSIHPILFNQELIGFCDEAIDETGAKPHRLPSGPLHDAAEVARAGVPTIMMFVQSLHGISHNKIEDTKEEHLEMAVTAFDKLADKAIAWIASR